MYNTYNKCQCPNSLNTCPYCSNMSRCNRYFSNQQMPFSDEMEYNQRLDFPESANEASLIRLKDYGPQPYVVDIEKATEQNNAFRTALWTGNHLQLTLMSIPVGGEIGLESHPNLDQFIRIEEGQGLVKMGDRKDRLDFQKEVYEDFAFIIPAGKWHNLINTGNMPIKLYSIYAPPQHPRGTVHLTKAEAEAAEEQHGRHRKEKRHLRQTKEFTLSELAQYNGTMGKPAYVAVNGVVYDVSNVSKWAGAKHYGLTAGKDLSSEFENCHGVSSKLAKLTKVGILKG